MCNNSLPLSGCGLCITWAQTVVILTQDVEAATCRPNDLKLSASFFGIIIKQAKAAELDLDSSKIANVVENDSLVGDGMKERVVDKIKRKKLSFKAMGTVQPIAAALIWTH
ncbi:hypothetical protein VNO77_24090 [Canavalia gladiata]|uniref:Uncharacterized protein n=1 Tax=Canavalia gladiata TaxID=3824 RepID=A0AAN9L8Y3_CANGL